jgi:hypothetical protein
MKTHTYLRLTAALGALALVLCAVVSFLLGFLSGQGADLFRGQMHPRNGAPGPVREERVASGDPFPACGGKLSPSQGFRSRS